MSKKYTLIKNNDKDYRHTYKAFNEYTLDGLNLYRKIHMLKYEILDDYPNYFPDNDKYGHPELDRYMKKIDNSFIKSLKHLKVEYYEDNDKIILTQL